jgi:multidrug resistance efflux pump
MTSRSARRKSETPAVEAVIPDAEPDLERIADQNVANLRAALNGKIVLPAPAPQPADPPEEPKTATPAQPPEAAAKASPLMRRTLPKILIGLCVAFAFGWLPLQRLLQPSSVEAVVNARLITIRSPIEGVVSLPGGVALSQVARGEAMLEIRNPRAERTQLDQLRRDIGRLEDEKAALALRREKLSLEAARLAAQTEAFREGRVRQLAARAAEITSDMTAAQAKADEAAATVARGTTLNRSGSYTTVDLDRARRDRIVAEEQHAAAARRLEATQVELEAARAGRFIGDSYNDRPQSAQRGDEVAARLDDLQEREEVIDRQLARLRGDLTAQGERAELESRAEIRAPIDGRVWEILTAPGEVVQRGQELLRILDCSALLVTASVTESVFNRLRLGMPARFRPAGSSETLPGTVTALTGIAGPRANFAIEPSSLAREPYRVAVTVPELGGEAACRIGRTGQVLFDGADSAISGIRGH